MGTGSHQSWNVCHYPVSAGPLKTQLRFTLFSMNFGARPCCWEPNTFVRSSFNQTHARTHTHTSIMANWEWKKVSWTRLIPSLNIKIYTSQSTNKCVGKTVKLISANIFHKISFQTLKRIGFIFIYALMYFRLFHTSPVVLITLFNLSFYFGAIFKK